MSKLLLIDDEEDVRYSFQRIFNSPDIELATASSGEEGLKVIPKFKPDLVLMDVRMTGMTGMETLRRIRQSDPKLLVILMTAYGTTQTAIEAMKLGAYDYLLKPFDIPKLKEIVGNALKAARDMKQVVSYEPLLESEDYELGIVGRSEPMQQVFKLIGQVAGTDATALVTGESGTGKELVARAIYHHSNRSAAAVPRGELRRDSGTTAGKRTVRPRKRLVHRRDQPAHRQIRAVQQGHDFPRRNRRHDAGHADQNPARAPKRHVRARRRQPAHPGGRARHRRHEQAARSRRGRQAVPRGFVLPAQRRAHPYPAAARPARRHPAAGELFSEESRAANNSARRNPSPPASSRRWKNTTGPATCANWRTPSAAHTSWPRATRFCWPICRRKFPARATGASAASANDAGEAAATDAAAIARQLFHWARRDPKLKIIPAVERELVVQALKETNDNQIQAAKLLGITRATLRKRIEKFGIQRELNVK